MPSFRLSYRVLLLEDLYLIAREWKRKKETAPLYFPLPLSSRAFQVGDI